VKIFSVNTLKVYKSTTNFITYVVFIFLSIQYSFGFQKQRNDTTIVNLQHINFDNHKEVVLDSGWAFYWNELIEPNNFNIERSFKKITLKNWTKLRLSNKDNYPSFGYATYKLNFELPKERPHLSLHIPAAYSSSKIWVNGESICEIGTVGLSKATTFHRRHSTTIPLESHINNFEIVIQISNFYHTKGGLTKAPVLATTAHHQTENNRKIISDMIFIGSLSFIGIFFLLFYLIYWNKDKAVLYFSVLCICWAYRALNDAYAPFAIIFPSVDWTFLTRIEYIALFSGGTAGCLFFITIFSRNIHKLYRKILVYSFAISVLMIVFLPSQYFTKLLVPFILFMTLYLSYMVIIIIKAIIDKQSNSILALVSILVGLAVFCSNVFVFFDGNGKDLVFVNLGYVFSFLLVSMLLMMRFSKSFRELENSKKIALEQKKEIYLKSNQLSSINLELEDNLKLLENHNAELDDFAHIVSHDLKAPLVAANALVNFIEEDLKTDIDTITKGHFELLKDRISKMGAMIDALLEYSKIAKGNKSKELFNLNNLLAEVMSTLNSDNKHTIILPEDNHRIYANKLEMRHVFQNLIQNAIAHNDKKNTIVTISFSNEKHMYQFSVSDNGPGIDPKYHDKIFNMFTQIDTDQKSNSTGIGLYIVKKIISENHGRISIESEKGIGTKISFFTKTGL